jgi:hypothetical protein
MTTSSPGPEAAPKDDPPQSANLPTMENSKQSFLFSIFTACIGFGLIVLPFLVDPTGFHAYRWPIIVVGLAIISAAVGAQAVARNKWFSAGGSAAMVLIFAQFLNPAPPTSFVYGYIRGTEGFGDMAVEAETPFLTGRIKDGGFFQFFAREEHIKGAIFSIRAHTAGALPTQIIIGCIPIELLRKYVGAPDGLDLTMYPDSAAEKQHYSLVQTDQEKPLGQWGNPECRPTQKRPLDTASLPWRYRDLLFSTAYAMDPNQTPDVDALFKFLDAADLATQVRAQDSVASLRDPKGIAAVIQGWTPARWTSRIDAGLLVAAVRAIRQNRTVAVPIAASLSASQLDHILDLAGNPDATVRYNATELLSWMIQSTGWPSPPPGQQSGLIVDTVLRPFSDAKSFFSPANGSPPINPQYSTYNAIVALDDAKCDMRAQDRKRMLATLKTFESTAPIKELRLSRTAERVGGILTGNCPN